MFCRFCGAQIPDGVKFCGNCGNQLAQDAPQQFQPAQPQSAAERIRESYQKGRQAGHNLFGGQKQQPQHTRQPYTQQQSAQPRQNTYGYGQRAAGKAARGAAARAAGGAAAKAGMGLGAKLAVGALAGAVVIGGGAMLLDDGGGDGGGGGYDPPVSYERSGGSGGYSGTDTGGYGGAYDAPRSGEYEYFALQIYAPEENDSTMLVHIDWNDGRPALQWVNSDGSLDDSFPLAYDASSGKLTLTILEDDEVMQMAFQRNADGTWSGTLDGESEEGRGSTYVKLTGAVPVGGDNWTIPATGETLSYYDLHNYAEDTELGKRFQREGEAHGYTIYEYNGDDTTQPYTPQTPAYVPSSGGTVDPPQDVLDYYVKTEAQNRLRENATGQAQGHVTLPSNWNITQAQFDALVENAMRGEIMGP